MNKKQHSKDDWLSYFPFPEPRPEQEIAINFILDAYASGYKYVCADLATGIGKSAIGVTVARFLQRESYILTTQKILQDQYDSDFGVKSNKKLLRTIKSSSNYQCSFKCAQSCGDVKRVLKSLGNEIQGTDFYNNCTYNCVFSSEKKKFVDSSLGVTNFAYFLAETMYAGQLGVRNLLIIDEAHNIEQVLSSFIEIQFSEKFAKEQLNITSFPNKSSQEKAFEWVKTKYVPAIQKQIEITSKLIIENYRNKISDKVLDNLAKKHSMLDKHMCKINRFIKSYEEDNWVFSIEPTPKIKSKKLEFKPVDISKLAQEELFCYGTNVLMMSATLINKDAFCRSVGLNPDDVAFLHMPSPFQVKNRLVNVMPVGKMSYNNIDRTLPIMAAAVQEILNQHNNEKGVIHCVSKKVANFIAENVKSNRILTHTTEDRDKILEKHKKSAKPTVLVSPSMAEGVDLADDASRFQILCKMPFPSLGDELVKKRMKRDKEWYAYQTLKTIVQSLGRSIRNENDFAVSYILDEDWQTFFRHNKRMFSEDFLSILR